MDLRRNKNTGVVEIWKNGKKVGRIITMGDEVRKNGRASQQPKRT